MASRSGQSTQIENWLRLIQAGDECARQRLLEHTCWRLRLIARSMLRGSPKIARWEQTDDVLVEAMSRLHRSLETVSLKTARDYYNLAAAQTRRVLIDMARHYYGREGWGAHHHSDAHSRKPRLAAHEPSDASGEPVGLMEWTEFHQEVEALPQEEREVFGLLWYAGLTQAEAAEALGLSERLLRRYWQSARVRLYRARGGEPPPT